MYNKENKLEERRWWLSQAGVVNCNVLQVLVPAPDLVMH